MILVSAPATLVWSYLENPLQSVSMSDQVVDVRDVVPCASGGYNCTVIYEMNGQRLEIPIETTEYDERTRRLVVRTRRGLESVQTWSVDEGDTVTQVNLHMEYKVDVPLLGKLAETVVARMGEGDIEQMLYRLKDNIEAVYRQQP